ncbi:MAG: TnpV protein [Clostridia bacterium]|nr:TnpV protein [Clostridia bacterium]
MNVEAVIKKAESDEGLTVKEIKVYQKAVKPVKHVYGKYGTLAKRYLEDKGLDWTIANLPEYLHGVDKAADELYETMYEKFSKEERFKRSEDFMENLKRETEMQRLIEEEILNEIVYVK